MASDVRWSSDGRSADAVFDAVIVGDRVPQNCDVFLLKEWPVVPILRDTLGRKLQELRITGLKLQPFGTSRWIDAVYELVIIAHKVPSDCDVFLLREWPVAPILRENVASRLRGLNVTGLSLRPIRVS